MAGWLSQDDGLSLFARSGNYYYTMDADRGKAYYPFLTSLQPRQERKRAKDARLRQKHIDLDRAFREEIIRKKEKVFRQQRRHARHALKSDHFEPFTDAAIEARQTLTTHEVGEFGGQVQDHAGPCDGRGYDQ